VSKYGGELSPALRTGEEGSEADDDFLQLVLRYTHEAANLELEEENSHAAMHNELPPKAMHHRLEPPAVTGGTHWHPQDRKRLVTSPSSHHAHPPRAHNSFVNTLFAHLTENKVDRNIYHPIAK